MMGRIAVVVIIALSMALSSCATTVGREPSWISGIYDSALQDEKYICSVGSGKTRQDAVNQALSLMAQSFSVSIKSVQSLVSTSSASSDPAGNDSFAESSILTEDSTLTSDVEEVLGVEIHDTYKDADGLFWVRACLDKDRTMTLYQAKVLELEKDMNLLINEARLDTNPLSSLSLMNKARIRSTAIDNCYDQMRMISKNSYSSKTPLVDAARKEILSNISFDIIVNCSDVAVSDMVYTSVSQILSGFGVRITTNPGSCRIVVDYQLSPLKMEGSPFSYCTYAVGYRLSCDGEDILSWQKNGRAAGISEASAYNEALKESLKMMNESLSSAEL